MTLGVSVLGRWCWDDLWPIARQMRALGMTRASFRYETRHAQLEVAYVLDVEPNVLLIGITGRNPFAFEVAIDHQCRVKPFLSPDDYHALLDALGVERDPDHPFSIRGFFDYLDQCVPSRPDPGGAPDPDFIAQFWNDVEDADKVYFVGWRHNPPGSHVTGDNLAKTQRLIGQGARESCARLNISSCWTADRNDKNPVTHPGDDARSRDEA